MTTSKSIKYQSVDNQRFDIPTQKNTGTPHPKWRYKTIQNDTVLHRQPATIT